MNNILLCYIAGPYRAETRIGVERNILNAKSDALRVIDMGYYPVVPHLNTAGFEILKPDTCDEYYLNGSLELMARCDAVWAMLDWYRSLGAIAEIEKAAELGIEIIYAQDYTDPAKLQERAGCHNCGWLAMEAWCDLFGTPVAGTNICLRWSERPLTEDEKEDVR